MFLVIRLFPMAILILLPASARARFISAGLFFHTHGLLPFFLLRIGKISIAILRLRSSCFVNALSSANFHFAGIHSFGRSGLPYLCLFFSGQRCFYKERNNVFVHSYQHLLEKI